MPKSQIIRELVDDNVPLEKSLNRLFVLAKDVGNEHLVQWAAKELNGYNVTDELPDYRKIKTLSLIYSGINGSYKVTKAPFPLNWLSSKTKDLISNTKIYEGIRYITDLSSSKEESMKDLTCLAGEVLENSNDIIQCVSIYQIIPKAFFQSICATVKNKMIGALLELEKEYGILDSLGIEISDKQKGHLKRTTQN